MESPSRQLALALFEDCKSRGDSVEKAPSELGFRRSNAFAKIVDLSLAARRLIDVTYFLVADSPDLAKEYRVDFNLFKWLLGTTSRNLRHYRTIVREAQRAAIELSEVDAGDPSKVRWGSVPLLGDTFIIDGEYIFELSERLQRAIKNPESSHFLSLRYVFNKLHAKVLFDRFQPYLTDGMTPWFDLAELRMWLSCEEKYPEYKHFRDKAVLPALADINAVAGIAIELLAGSSPGSKKITRVRFRIEGKQPQDGQNALFVVLKALYDTLRKDFALNQAEFDEIISNRAVYTDERINQAIEYTRYNIDRKKVKIRAGGYLMKALREGYLVGEEDKRIHGLAQAEESAQKVMLLDVQQREDQQAAAAEDKKQKEAELGWEAYNKLAPEEQEAMASEFSRSQAAKLLARVIKVEQTDFAAHLTHPSVYATFGAFVAGKVMKPVRTARAKRTTAVAA